MRINIQLLFKPHTQKGASYVNDVCLITISYKHRNISIFRYPKLLSTIQDEGSTRSVMLSAKYFEPLASVPVGLLLRKIIRKIDYIFWKIKEKRKRNNKSQHKKILEGWWPSAHIYRKWINVIPNYLFKAKLFYIFCSKTMSRTYYSFKERIAIKI